MKDLILSIIIPVYNGGKYIDNCLKSVIKQLNGQFEIIIVDDGSTDNTYDISYSYSHCNESVFLYRLNNSGVSHARNYGAQNANGNWLLFLDSDDALMSNAVEVIFNEIKNTKFSVVYGSNKKVTEVSPVCYVESTSISFPTGNVSRFLLKNNFIVNGGAMLIRREAFNYIGGYNEKLRLGEDWEMWCRLSIYYDFKHIPYKINQYFISSSGANNFQRLLNSRSQDFIDVVYSNPDIKKRFNKCKLFIYKRSFKCRFYWDSVRLNRASFTKVNIIFYFVKGVVLYPESIFKIDSINRYRKSFFSWK